MDFPLDILDNSAGMSGNSRMSFYFIHYSTNRCNNQPDERSLQTVYSMSVIILVMILKLLSGFYFFMILDLNVYRIDYHFYNGERKRRIL